MAEPEELRKKPAILVYDFENARKFSRQADSELIEKVRQELKTYLL